MAKIEAKGRFHRQPAPPGRAVFVAADGSAARIDVAGWQGSELPQVLVDPVFEVDATEPARWRLRHGGGEAIVEAAAGVSLIEPRPGLLEPLGAPFALKPRERGVARVLLALLRLPGGARLLRAWHARRG